jgi:hypothetical protein
MRRFLPVISLAFFIAPQPTFAAEVSCLDYGAPSASYAAQARSQKNTAVVAGSNVQPEANPFDRFDDIPAPCAKGLLRGPIVEGDYEKVLRLFRESHPVLDTFTLIFAGGNVNEAVKIGGLFRKYAIEAQAPFRLSDRSFMAFSPVDRKTPLCAEHSQCVCASACALIWLGAIERWGSVGLHRPHTSDTTFKAMSPTEASNAYGRMLNIVVKYLDEMEVPKQIAETMVATGSAEIRWINSLQDNVRRPPSIAEWEDASCGSFTDDESETERLLDKRHAALTQTEANLLKSLRAKRSKKEVCELLLISSHRQRLPPP